MARPKEFSEEEALTKAAEVFWRNGYHNSSMQELVAEMGVCRASIYETYGDKHALYLKALDQYRALSGKTFHDVVDQVDTARGKIQAIMNVVIDQQVVNDARGCFMTNATLEMLPEYKQTVGPLVGGNMDTLEALFISILAEGVNTGELRPDLPVASTARFMLGLVGGVNVVGKVRPDRATLNEIVDVGLRSLAC